MGRPCTSKHGQCLRVLLTVLFFITHLYLFKSRHSVRGVARMTNVNIGHKPYVSSVTLL